VADPSSFPKIRTDLAYYGVVTRVISATQFVAAGLAGLGDGALVGYAAYVLAKANGTTTAPHAEQPAVSAYVSGSGTFTHAAYTAPLAVGDQLLLLHPNISTIPVAWVAAILAAVGPTGVNQGLVYYGVVTAVPAANQFTIPTLAGLGAGKFTEVGGLGQYYAFVFRDAAGGSVAPQGESQLITNYGTATGNFTANAFTVPVDIGDEILIIHPFLARIMNFAGLPPIGGSLAANWQAAETNLVLIGAANTRYKVHSLFIDMTTIVGSLTIRMYHPIIGVETQVYSQAFTVAANGPGRWTINGTVGIFDVLRVTCQSDNAADNPKTLAYSYMLEEM